MLTKNHRQRKEVSYERSKSVELLLTTRGSEDLMDTFFCTGAESFNTVT